MTSPSVVGWDACGTGLAAKNPICPTVPPVLAWKRRWPLLVTWNVDPADVVTVAAMSPAVVNRPAEVLWTSRSGLDGPPMVCTWKPVFSTERTVDVPLLRTGLGDDRACGGGVEDNVRRRAGDGDSVAGVVIEVDGEPVAEGVDLEPTRLDQIARCGELPGSGEGEIPAPTSTRGLQIGHRAEGVGDRHRSAGGGDLQYPVVVEVVEHLHGPDLDCPLVDGVVVAHHGHRHALVHRRVLAGDQQLLDLGAQAHQLSLPLSALVLYPMSREWMIGANPDPALSPFSRTMMSSIPRLPAP